MTPKKMAEIHAASSANHRIWNAHEFADLLSSPGVVAECHSNGFALARIIDLDAELLLLVTEQIRQNTGIATRCLLKMEKHLVKVGARELTLEVSESNGAAINLYKKLNYKKIFIRRSYSRDKNGNLENALLMQKELIPL
jgi:ribosomal-protein-alanine N-acetyltransferase